MAKVTFCHLQSPDADAESFPLHIYVPNLLTYSNFHMLHGTRLSNLDQQCQQERQGLYFLI